MKKAAVLLIIVIILSGCKTFFKGSNTGSFKIENHSNKVIEFVWIAPEGEFYPTVQSIDVKQNESYEIQGLESGNYDIAIDFKDEYNSFNSKKDKNLMLNIDKGITTIWYVDSSGNILR